MPAGFYRNFDTMGGLSYDGSAYHQFGFPMSGANDIHWNPVAGGIDWIHGLTSAPDNLAKIYAWAFDPAGSNAFVYRSTDAGATWSKLGQFPGRNGQVPGANHTTAQPTNQLWVADATDNSFTSRHDGIWRSTDDGSTWTRILVCEGTTTVYFMSGSTPTTSTAPRGAQSASFGASKLWFCWQVSGNYANSPYPSPPAGVADYRIEQANPDGTARTTIADITLYARSTYDTAHDNRQLPLRPYGDSYVLIPGFTAQFSSTSGPGILFRVDSSGTVTLIPTPDGPPLDAIPLGPTTYLVMDWVTSTSSVEIYRTIDSGTTWSLVQTLSGPDYAGYPSVGHAADSYYCWQIAPIAGTNDIFVAGGQGTVGPGGSGSTQTAELVTWHSADLGVTWTRIYEPAPPAWVDDTGYWMNGTLYGICPGVPGVVPPTAYGVNQVSIVG